MERRTWRKLGENAMMGKEAQCPDCGSNIKIGYKIISADKHGVGAIWCPKCNRGYFISRAKIEDYMPLISDDDLKGVSFI